MTNPIVRVTVVASTTEGDLDVTATQPAVQRLRAIFDADQPQPFDGTGCSDHVRRRNIAVPVALAVILLVVLIALLVL